jgi:opacity protein-like surface antigen
MKKSLILIAVALMCTMAAVAQDVPKFEVPVGFSFVNVHPNLSPITSFNVFGGGGGFVYNVTPWIGVKADFFGYTQGSGLKNQLTNAGYTVGQVNGNVFTYMFGPQIKKHSGKFQPFGEALFGAAHSNAYAQVYNTIHGGVSGSSNNNAFAMEFGGGLDYALTPHIQLRPVEVDYLYTRFGINGTNYTGNQNNFKYVAGVNFTFGGK